MVGRGFLLSMLLCEHLVASVWSSECREILLMKHRFTFLSRNRRDIEDRGMGFRGVLDAGVRNGGRVTHTRVLPLYFVLTLRGGASKAENGADEEDARTSGEIYSPTPRACLLYILHCMY